jgi:5'-3' exonuclease
MGKTFLKFQQSHNNAIIIDALNLGFRWKHSNRTEFAEDYLKTVQSLASSYKCDKVIIACDKGSSSYRKERYPEYKLSRKERYEKQTQEEKDSFVQFYQEMEKTLELLAEKYIVLQYDGVEADDIAAYISTRIEADHIWMVSSDRDWDLLISENVSRFAYTTRSETTFENWRETHDYSIEDYITIKCLNGDSGDNIPGIPSIGPKRACDLLHKYGNLFDIYDACPISSKYKYIQSLNDNKEKLILNFELMDLLGFCEQAIGEENIKDIQSKCQSILIKEKISEARLHTG